LGCGLHRQLRDGRDEPAELAGRELVSRSRQIELWRLEIVADGAVDEQRALGSPYCQLLDVDIVITNADLAREAVQRKLRIARTKRQVAQSHGHVYGLVREVARGVDAIDRSGQPIAVRRAGCTIVDRHAAIADTDVGDLNRPRRALPVCLLLLRL